MQTIVCLLKTPKVKEIILSILGFFWGGYLRAKKKLVSLFLDSKSGRGISCPCHFAFKLLNIKIKLGPNVVRHCQIAPHSDSDDHAIYPPIFGF